MPGSHHRISENASARAPASLFSRVPSGYKDPSGKSLAVRRVTPPPRARVLPDQLVEHTAEVGLVSEAADDGDLAQRQRVVSHQFLSSCNTSLHDERPRRFSHRAAKGAMKVRWAVSDEHSEIARAQTPDFQVRIDVIDDSSNLPSRQSTSN
jgi:hypothetical protein